MSSAFTNWLNTLLGPFVDVYGKMLAGFPLNILSYILSAILLALFMQVVFSIIPQLKSIIDAIMFPFRILHIWLHVQAAREVIEKAKASETNNGPSLRFVSYYTTGFSVKEEKHSIALSGTCSPREAAKIANAPLKGALILLIVLTMLTPLLRESFTGKLIHLYIFIGIATSSFPSASDYKFTYNMVLLNSSIRPSLTLLPVAAFSAGFIIVIIWTNNIVLAVIWSIGVATLSTRLILMGLTVKKERVKEDRATNTNDSFSTDEKNLKYEECVKNTQDTDSLVYHELEYGQL
ncbi:MAG: hypothetical protein ACFFD4_37955 [Candidatus Odinarchaeota archaeon]